MSSSGQEAPSEPGLTELGPRGRWLVIEDSLSCPLPHEPDVVTLGHGSGGRLSHRLQEEVFLPAFRNPALEAREDQAVVPGGERLAFSTDGFVVSPMFFPGGDLGELAVNGTVNDLACSGAEPRYLSAAFILEEGLPLQTLRRLVDSMARAAKRAGVSIVTGDTKVVQHGKGDGAFIVTSGIGVLAPGVDLGAQRCQVGDLVLVSGTLGDHGMAVMSARDDLGLSGELRSDTAPLHELARDLLSAAPNTRCLRDPTRGGVAAALSEIAACAGVAIELEEEALPISESVRGALEILGLDALLVANEGKLCAVVPAEEAEAALAAWRAHPLGEHGAQIGRVVQGPSGRLSVKNPFGGSRRVILPLTDPLPRIC